MTALWLPDSARPKPGLCRLCQARLTEGELARHAINCAKAHEDKINERARFERMRPLEAEIGDLEYETWVRQHGRVR